MIISGFLILATQPRHVSIMNSYLGLVFYLTCSTQCIFQVYPSWEILILP